MEYYSVIKKNEILPSVSHAKWNKSDREKQILYVSSYRWNLKNKTNIIKKKQTHRYREQASDCQREGGG